MKKCSGIVGLIIGICSSLSAQDATRLFKLGEAESAKILETEGESVRVMGYVESTRTNATGIHFLHFQDADFVCVTFPQFLDQFGEEPPSKQYAEKWIEVSGEIQNYRGTPQIRLTSPDQVKLIAAPPVPKPVVEEPEKVADPKEEETEVPKPEEAPKPKEEKKTGPVLEVIDGVEALDWRKYFPE